jgi:lipopolysaccharide/colanic/teichoic acid biosynthesis glycosyltransferase
MDRIFAFVILIGTLPFFGLVAILLGISLNKWPFFIQKRPGYKQTIPGMKTAVYYPILSGSLQ